MKNHRVVLFLTFVLLTGVLAGCRSGEFQELNRQVKWDRFKKQIRQDLKQHKKAYAREIKSLKQDIRENHKTINELKGKQKRMKKELSSLRSTLQNRLLATKEASQFSSGSDGGSSDEPPSSQDAETPSNTAKKGGSPAADPSTESGTENRDLAKARELLSSSTESNSDTETNPPQKGAGSAPQKGAPSNRTSESTDRPDQGETDSGADDKSKEPTNLRDRIWKQLAREKIQVEKLKQKLQPDVKKHAGWLLKGLLDRKLARRRNTEELVVSIGKEPFQEPLMTLLNSSSYTLRIIRLAGRLQLTSAKERLKELQKNGSPETRYYATRALVQLGDRASVPKLIEYLSGDHGDQLFKMDAHQVLKNVMGRDFGHKSAVVATSSENQAKEQDWKNWWNAYRNELNWNPENGQFTLADVKNQNPVTVEPHEK